MNPAPAVVRATRLLDFFAQHPTEAFSLTQLANVLGASLPSTLAILEALGAAGYVVRHAVHKTYTLGPGLVPVGDAAHLGHPVVDAARDELRLLADELSCECVGAMQVRDDIVFIATAGRPRSDTMPVHVGMRIPYRAPFGFTYAAWSDGEARRRWITAGSVESVAERDYLGALDAVRERQVCFGVESEARVRFLRRIDEGEHGPERVRASMALDAALVEVVARDTVDVNLAPARFRVTAINAPVFGPLGQVVLGISAQGFAAPPGARERAALAARVRASAQTIGRASGL